MPNIKETIPVLRQEIADALVEVGKKHGFVFRLGLRATYNDTSVNFKLEALKTTANGGELDADRIAFNRLAPLVGLEDGDYGLKLRLSGDWFQLLAIKLNRPKFPITAKRVRDGKLYKFTRRQVLDAKNPVTWSDVSKETADLG